MNNKSKSAKLVFGFITSLTVLHGFAPPLQAAETGRVYSWGSNYRGMLGNGITEDSNVPVVVTPTGSFVGKDIVSVASGQYQSLALTSDGAVYTWGRNDYGQLGDGSTQDRHVPVPVISSGVLAGRTLMAIDSAFDCTIALDTEGRIYGWGWGGNLQLGDIGQPATIEDAIVRTPILLNLGNVLDGMQVVALATGGLRSIALTSTGRLFTWGNNRYGAFGNGVTGFGSATPVEVNMTGVLAGKTITATAAGNYHTLVLASDGLLYTWGRNNLGQLGNGTTVDSNIPVAVDMGGALAGKTIDAIGAGDDYCMVLTSEGSLYAWGENESGQLGIGTNVASPTAAAVVGIPVGQVTKFSCGRSNNIALTSDGRLYGWGWRPGDGAESSNAPVQVDMNGVLAGRTVLALSAGPGTSLVVASGGDIVQPAVSVTSPADASAWR